MLFTRPYGQSRLAASTFPQRAVDSNAQQSYLTLIFLAASNLIHQGAKLPRVLIAAIVLLLAMSPAQAADYTYGRDPDKWFSSLDSACRYFVTEYGNLRGRTYAYAPPVPDGGGWTCAFYDDFFGNGNIGTYVANFVSRRGDTCAAPKVYDPVAHRCEISPPACPAGQKRRTPGGSCIDAPPALGQEGQQSSNGPSCSGNTPDPSCGQPINPGNGNMWHVENDYTSAAVGNLALSRTYNSNPLSLDAARLNLFGVRWTTRYDAVLRHEVAKVHNAPVGECVRFADTQKVACYVSPVGANVAIPDAVSVSRGDGKRIFFNRTGNAWVSSSNISDRITPVFNTDSSAVIGWIFYAAGSNGTEHFDATGKLLAIQADNGTTQRLTYSTSATYDTTVARYPADAPSCSNVHPGAPVEGRLLCVTDDWGRQLNFEYDLKARVSKMTDAAGEAYLYAYDGSSAGCYWPTYAHDAGVCGANNLTSVTYPGNKNRIYYYNELSRLNGGNACAKLPNVGSDRGPYVHALTGIGGENGKRHIAWTYDCDGRATSSHVGLDVEKVTLAYGTADLNGNAMTSVTHLTGTPENPVLTTTQYAYSRVLGVNKNTSVDRQCVECGPIASRTYDANGNPNILTDWNGVQTKYTYDLARNLETSRIEGFGTLLARTITTSWHPTLRKPDAIAQPKKITQFTYYPNGQVRTRIEQATVDLTGAAGLAAVREGAPKAFAYTYDSFQQLETIDGPRTDVADITRYERDSATGNMSSVINAKGHATLLSNYDANGRPRRIEAPNGAVTTIAYTPRGWIDSQSVSAGGVTQTTDYEYDEVGQVKKMTLPGNISITYEYDDARRMTGIVDNEGNRIEYKLDYVGNRVREQTKDAQANLVRQVTRQFDILNRLKEVTGAAQ